VSKFYNKKVAFYSDYKKLNRILPKESANLLSINNSINSVYLPRKVYMSSHDVPSGTRLFLLSEEPEKPQILDGYQLNDLVYENKQAHIQTYQTPGRADDISSLRIFKLQRSG